MESRINLEFSSPCNIWNLGCVENTHPFSLGKEAGLELFMSISNSTKPHCGISDNHGKWIISVFIPDTIPGWVSWGTKFCPGIYCHSKVTPHLVFGAICQDWIQHDIFTTPWWQNNLGWLCRFSSAWVTEMIEMGWFIAHHDLNSCAVITSS